jgi:hypothetical protein
MNLKNQIITGICIFASGFSLAAFLFLHKKAIPIVQNTSEYINLETRKQLAEKKVQDGLGAIQTLMEQSEDQEKTIIALKAKLAAHEATPEPVADPSAPLIEQSESQKDQIAWLENENGIQKDLIKKQDEDIDIKNKQLAAFDEIFKSKNEIIDSQNKELDLFKKQQINLQKEINKALWKGRCQGFGIGIGIGWLGGKFL